MSFIRWWTIGLMLMGATMTLTLGVVALQYYVYIDAVPEMRQQLPGVLRMVALFLALALTGVTAYLPLRWNNRWLWPTQAFLAVGVVVIGLTFWRMVSL